jgi:hypothetical protein
MVTAAGIFLSMYAGWWVAMIAARVKRVTAWDDGYSCGYDDRQKMDFDRADVIKTVNPHVRAARF